MSDRQRSRGSSSAGGEANGKHAPKANPPRTDTVSEQTPLLSQTNGENVRPAAGRSGAGPSGERQRSDTNASRQQPPPPPPPVRPGPGRLQRWNKYYSPIVKVIGTLLLLCLFIVVMSSWVAQRVLDHAMVFEIQKAVIRDMDETGFQTTIQSTIYLNPENDGFFGLSGFFQRVFEPTLTIEPTTLTMGIPSTEDEPQMAEFQVQQQQMQIGKVLRLDITSHVRVTNIALMAKFFGQTLEQSKVDLILRGPLVSKLAPLWSLNLWLDQTVPLEGLKGIQNASLISMELPDNHPMGGISMSGVARINNPSKVMSLYMGPVTFGIYLPSKGHPEVDLYKIAEAVSPGLHLEAGKANDGTLSGRLLHLDDWILNEGGQSNVSRGSEKQLILGELMSRFIQGKDSTIKVRALTKDPNMPLWMREAFKTIALEMAFPGSPNKDFIKSLAMEELGMGFTDSEESALLDGRMSSVLQLPPNVTFPIKLLRMKPDASLKLPGGSEMARMIIPEFQPATSRQDGTTLNVDLTLGTTPLEVVPERKSEFLQFLNSSFNEDWVDLGIAGGASAVVETGLGTFELGPIPFDVVTRQRGGFAAEPPRLLGMDIVGSTDSSLTIKTALVVYNPSTISASLGDLTFLMSYGDHWIGSATVSNANVKPGNNTLECIGKVDPSIDCALEHDAECDPELATAAVREFFSKYIAGDNTTSIGVLGYSNSTQIPLLRPVMSSFALTSLMPPVENEFLVSSTMYLFSHSMELELKNPLNTPITILSINGTASYKGQVLGRILVDFESKSHHPIEVPANDHKDEDSGYVKTPRLPVAFNFSSKSYEALRKALGGSLDVDILCHIQSKVGSMLMWVDYSKDGVTTRVRKGF
ncbi:hypothetical protein BGX31_002648 [Mortierella sp. GBA43]|nr:hypothetical protein BGX31_002648 [Mortierella sp. GBA43]